MYMQRFQIVALRKEVMGRAKRNRNGKEVIKMEIQVKKLRDALDLIVPVIPGKTQVKSVSYVRLGEGRVVATNLTISAAFQLPGANEDLLLPGKDAMEFLKYALGAAMAQITADDGKVTITAGGMETSFTDVPSVDEFPPLPKVEGENQGVINGDMLVRTLVALVPYAASENTRPVLNGVNLTPGDEVEAAAADGFRLAWRAIPGRLSGPSMIIPHKGVDVLEHLWKRAAAPELSGVSDIAGLARAQRLIRLNWGEKHLKLQFDSVTLIICLITGSYPNYHQLIPKETQPPVTVDAEEMYRALSQMAHVAKDNRGIVRLRWEEEVLQLSAKGEAQEVSVPIPAQLTEPGSTAINIQYLREYFKGLSGMVSLQAESPTSPVLFTYRGKPDIVVMPMFVEKDAKAKAEVEEVVEEAEAEIEEEIDEPIDEQVEEPIEKPVEEPVKKKVKAKK